MNCLEICGDFIFKYFFCCFVPGPVSNNNLGNKINVAYFYAYA